MKPLSQSRIFIVEDNFMYSYVLENMLKEYGNFKISSFASGEECLKMVYTNPDVIILDYNLETSFNGHEAFKIIHKENPEIPVIILSSQTDVQVTADLLAAGVFDYIEKKDKEKAFKRLLESILKALALRK